MQSQRSERQLGASGTSTAKEVKISQTPIHQKSQNNTGMMFMMSEKGGDGGLDFRFDNRSNASGGGLHGKGTGGTGGAHSEDNNLLELMVM